jgi:hypothetical protein
MPQDQDSAVIQVLAPVEQTVVRIAITGASARAALPPNTEICEICATDFCAVAFGDAAVVAGASTSRVLVPGVFTYEVPTGATHLAVIQLGTPTGPAALSVTRLI